MNNYSESLNKFIEVADEVKDLINQYPSELREKIIFDKWSLKDVIAHLNHWMVHDIDCLEHLKEGKEPYWEPDVEEFNTRGVNASKNKSWKGVYEEFNTLTNRLIKLYKSLPEDLQNKRIWKDKTETPLKFLQEDIKHWEGEHIPSLIHHLPIDKDWISSKTEILESEIGGKGLFAIKPIKRDELVVVWRGNYVNKKEADEAQKAGKLVMQWDNDLFSVEERGDDSGYYINHSCDPNLWMEGAYSLTAMKDIDAGEELTADYAMWEADENYVSKWECHCDSKDCRHKITGKDWKLKTLQERYSGHFSPLINKKINNL